MWILSYLVCLVIKIAHADNGVFGDDLIDIKIEDIQKHVASSVENLAELLCSEQRLLDGLINFKTVVEKETEICKDKSIQNMIHIIKKIEKYKLFEQSSQEVCLEHVSNPINSFLLLKRTTRIMSKKIKNLKVNFKSIKNKEKIKIHFPFKEIDSLAIPEEVDYAEVKLSILKIIITSIYVSRAV